MIHSYVTASRCQPVPVLGCPSGCMFRSQQTLQALDIMRQFGVRSLPVLDEDLGRCVGLITMDDVAKTKATRGVGVGGDVALIQLDKDSVDM